MKRLTLVRHAQAETALAGQSDFDRALTRRGAEDANEMARRLKRRKWAPDLIVSSTAVRALATAEIFARVLHGAVQADDRVYTAGASELLRVLHDLGGQAGHVMIVAHNPTITEFADQLCADRSVEAMPTCAFVSLQLPVETWTEAAWDQGMDGEFDYPGQVG